MYNVSYPYFESWIESISYVRNVCAHYGRVYNVKLVKTPMLYKQFGNIDKYKIFAILLCLKELIPNDNHWIQFVDTLELLIEKYSSVNLEKIGFPDNWKDFLLM